MMESPVVLDKPPEYHTDDRGFPFDEEEGGAWSELSSRRPDLAARLRHPPTAAAAAWARKRRPSSQDADDFDSFSDFDRFIPSEFREHFPSYYNRGRFREEPATAQQSPSQAQAAQSPPRQHTAATQTEPPPPNPPPTHLPQYGLRNTVDLGQKSAADPSLVDAEDRAPRSMSAPPERTPRHDMSAPSAPPAPDQPPAQPKVRIVPVVVEGRADPLYNDLNQGSQYDKAGYSPPQPPHEPAYFTEDHHFNHPSSFTRSFGTPFAKQYRQGQPFAQQKVYPQSAGSFARGASPQRAPPEEYVQVPVHHERPNSRQHQHPPQQKEHHQQQQQPPQQQQHQQQQHPPPPPPKQPTPPPQQKPAANDPISQILEIQTNVLNLMTEVEKFQGTKKDKQYLYLDEMLTLNLIKLDNIETDGKENIRNARKEAIRCIQKCIAVLEAKAEKGSAEEKAAESQNPQDVEMESQQGPDRPDQPAENGELEVGQEATEQRAEHTSQPEQKQDAPATDTKQTDAHTAPDAQDLKQTTEVKRDTSKDRANENKPEAMAVDKGDLLMEVDGAASH